MTNEMNTTNNAEPKPVREMLLFMFAYKKLNRLRVALKLIYYALRLIFGTFGVFRTPKDCSTAANPEDPNDQSQNRLGIIAVASDTAWSICSWVQDEDLLDCNPPKSKDGNASGPALLTVAFAHGLDLMLGDCLPFVRRR